MIFTNLFLRASKEHVEVCFGAFVKNVPLLFKLKKELFEVSINNCESLTGISIKDTSSPGLIKLLLKSNLTNC